MKNTQKKVRSNRIITQNIELLGKFNRYLVEHPEITNFIPEGAEVVLLPVDSPSLLKANLKILEKLLLRKYTPTVLVKVSISNAKDGKSKATKEKASSFGVLSVVSI